MESLFDVHFHKWCSRANQIAFHDCQKKLQNHVFSRIVHLASTRAPVIAAHSRLLEPWPESHQIEPLGTGFVDFWNHGQKIIKSRILGSVSSTSGAMARKSSNRASWDRFRQHLEPLPGSHQITHPGIGFVNIWRHGQKVIKSSILGSVSSMLGAMARKSSNRTSWDRFRRHWEQVRQPASQAAGYV